MQVNVYDMPSDKFLSYAKLFRRGELPLQEFVTLRDTIKKRCNELGYTWTPGCCGVNKLTKIEYASKN